MKIGILSTGSHIYGTRRIEEAAIERGHQAIVLNTMRSRSASRRPRRASTSAAKPLGRYDAMIPRIGAERQILLGDTLLCGGTLALRSPMPPPRGARAKREA